MLFTGRAICVSLNRSFNDNSSMSKFDGIKGQELLDVEESVEEITLIFKDNRFLFIKVDKGKLVCDSVPE
jgi:hypothetical protein